MPDLFRYQNFITRQSRHFKAYAWLQYNAQFRLKLASNPSIKWFDTDTELIPTWLSADAAREKPACFACGNSEHLASDCPWKVSGTSNSSVLNCPVCNASGHAARDCPKLGHPVPPSADTRHAGVITFTSTSVSLLGLRSAPFLFNMVADALHWILQHYFGRTSNLFHYLDALFFAGPANTQECHQALADMLT